MVRSDTVGFDLGGSTQDSEHKHRTLPRDDRDQLAKSWWAHLSLETPLLAKECVFVTHPMARDSPSLATGAFVQALTRVGLFCFPFTSRTMQHWPFVGQADRWSVGRAEQR